MSSIIGVKVPLAMLKKSVSESVGFKVEHYEMICIFLDRSIKFKIFNGDSVRVYPYDKPEDLYLVIDDLIKTELKTGDQIDVLIVDHNDDKITLHLLYRDEQENKHKLIKEI